MQKSRVLSYILIITMILSFIPLYAFAATDKSVAVLEESFAEYDAVTVNKILTKTNVLDLKAKASVLMDANSGKVLIENNSHDKLAIASVTKIMSMLLFMEAIDSGKLTYEDRVSVSEYAAGYGGSQAYLKPGEEFAVSEMLKAIAVHSSNDVTVAMAEKVCGSEDIFVSEMNRRARELGMKDTTFLDCTGLNDDGSSSAYDVAIMSKELVTKHPNILQYTSIWHDTFRNGTFSLDNTNKLVKFYQNADGLKTGFTQKAGFNLSATAKRNNMRLISVVLGEPDSNTRFAESRKLLDYGYANYEVISLDQKGTLVGSIPVKKGMKLKVGAVYSDDTSVLVMKGEKGKIDREVVLEPGLTAPVKNSQRVGHIIYKIDGNEVGRFELMANEDINKVSFVSLFTRLLLRWFNVGRA